ncbi:MAG: hypothetical protein EHM55_24190 [Acidobacteria bacterium]|nr:MAG: hypothetical protein EHM55_24190 [Acidobacteriota bacterium]
MGLPFTNDQFFGIFADYNDTFIVAAVAFWLASVLTLAYVYKDPADRSRTLSFFLGALWLWTALAYHALLFTRINPAAWVFAALFVVQAWLFFRAGARRRVEYFSPVRATQAVGVGLVAYALAYPFLTIALGHSYPATPTFGVPCPTAILTVGVLATARGRVPPALAIVPILWGFIGGSAAVLLAVATDYVLLGAGIMLTLLLIAQRVRVNTQVSRP